MKTAKPLKLFSAKVSFFNFIGIFYALPNWPYFLDLAQSWSSNLVAKDSQERYVENILYEEEYRKSMLSRALPHIKKLKPFGIILRAAV